MKKLLLILFISFNSYSIDYELNVVGKNLNQFISWFSDISHKTIILDKDVDGTVFIFARTGVKGQDLYPLFFSVLKSQGLEYRIENNIYRVYKSKLNLMPEDIITEFYDFKNISGKYVDNLIPSLNLLSSQLINTHYTKSKDSKFNDKNAKFSIESIFNGRSVLVTAPRFVHKHLIPILKRLDSSLPQILVKVAVIETVDTELFDVGVKWLLKSSKNSFGNNHQPSLDESLALLIDNVGFDAALSIVDKTDNVNIKSMPQLLILHGETGSINVGQNVPFLSGSTVTSGTNAGNPYQTIERQDVGLILNVQPYISNNNIIVNIEQELSSISSDIQASDIITDKRSLKTSLNIKNGESVVLGGLVSDFKTETVSGIPLLMDIPFIGSVFTNKSDMTVKRNLSIVLEVVVL
jgi:general secretion pathway protein D